MGEETVTVRLSRWDGRRMDQCIAKGLFKNRSDFIRTALRNMADDLEDVPEVIVELRKETKRRGITQETVRKWSKQAGKEAHSKR
jgi:Arc/MetJ-type ribon-helix-helix transcriptional regulator